MMINKLNTIIKSILELGMKYCNSYKDSKRLILSNQVCFLFLSASFIYIFIFYYLNAYHLSILIFGFVLIYGFIFYLNYKNKFELSRLLLIMTINCGVYVFGALCGEKSGIQFMVFPLLLLPFILSESQQKLIKTIFTVCPVFIFILLNNVNHTNVFDIIISESLYPILYSSVMLTSFFILLMLIRFYNDLSQWGIQTLHQVLKHYPLTQREIEIVSEVMSGKTNADIASRLFIEECTVKLHLKNIFKKLNVKRKTELMAFVIQ